MGLKAALSKPFAKNVHRKNQRWINNPVDSQRKVFDAIVTKARDTVFGQDHDFKNINSYEDFKKRVPVRDYEQLRPYVDKIIAGTPDVLWPGFPVYFAKTSGTTSGVKYIPITKDSIPNHINSARDALLNYIYETGNNKFLNGKLIFLSGSPVLEKTGDILTGRLSGIVNHHVPKYLRKNQLPSYETNCVDDWEKKLELIINETIDQKMSLISGIPPWVQMYFDRLTDKTGMKIKDIFPDFSVFVYGGVNFEPYKAKLFESIGKKIDSIETFPASEGFIAYQDSQTEEGLLLLTDSGIFFEFIPLDQIHEENPDRLMLGDVELNKNYVLIINSNAGLWGYNIGDTVKIVSKEPYRLVVSGRVKHFISAFGEHVIGEEVEKAMKYAIGKQPDTEVIEFTVAPHISSGEGQSCHEWFVEFAKRPSDIQQFAQDLDSELSNLNIYYKDLIEGSILKNLEIVELRTGAFRDYMKSVGKLGGQNKVPRLANNRDLAEELEKLKA